MNAMMLLTVWGVVLSALILVAWGCFVWHWLQSHKKASPSLDLTQELEDFIEDTRKARRKKRREYFQQVRKLQKDHLVGEQKQGLEVNRSWKKEWLPFIKYDYDWDWSFLLDLIIYKLEKTRVTLTMFATADQDWRDRVNQELTEVIDLGKKLQTYDYYQESYDFMEDHTVDRVFIYRGPLWASSNAEPIQIIDCPRKTFDEKLESRDWMGSKTADQWLLDHNYDKKDFHYAFSLKWDSDEDKTHHMALRDKAAEEEQADYEKFFALIAQYLRGWWD